MHCCISGRQQFYVLALCAECAAGYGLCDCHVSDTMTVECVLVRATEHLLLW